VSKDALSKSPRVSIWFAAAATIFFTRAFLFSTWLTRGPEVQEALGLNTAQFGLIVMLYPAGGLLGILFATRLTNRFGSGRLTIFGYLLAAVALALLGVAIEAGNVPMAALLLLLIGLPMALADFLGNYEGTAVDKISPRSLLPGIHAAFGVGMMAGAWFSGFMIEAGHGIQVNYLWVALFVAVPSVLAGLGFPKSHKGEQGNSNTAVANLGKKVWTERRTLLIAVVGFSFIMAEISAGTWVPIALTNSGFTSAEAAGAMGIFWIVVTATRALGGFAVEKFGRYATMLGSTVVTAAGLAMFMLDSVLHLTYPALILWSLGLALGFPLSVSAMGDDPAKSAARINMIITVVYISSISVGPSLGALGQQVGVYFAFAIPLTMMLISMLLSRNTRTEK
jgi:fucose permease